MDGAGGTGPGLNRSVLGRAPDDQALFSVIKEGIPGTEMPRAWQMIEGEIWQVAGYVRSLGQTARVSLPGKPAQRAAEPGQQQGSRQLRIHQFSCDACRHSGWA
jgi:mono/diheme cytochrome c family protein